MSVLIKGMEIPKNCNVCNFHMLRFCCAADKDLAEKDTRPLIECRPDWCPLVPVAPHGRLIDVDELRCLYDPHDYGLDGEQADEYDRYHVSLPVIRQNIDDMPTIIPAEEGET